MTALALTLKPVAHGWVVVRTDGSELARFTGIGAKRRALHHLARAAEGLAHGAATVRRR